MDVSIRSTSLPRSFIATNTRFSAADEILSRKARQMDWGVLQAMLWSEK
jgi:hypothetical protein